MELNFILTEKQRKLKYKMNQLNINRNTACGMLTERRNSQLL